MRPGHARGELRTEAFGHHAVSTRLGSILDRPWLFASACFAVAFVYAVARYHVFGSIGWTRLPLFTMNKAVSFAAVLLFAAVYLLRPAPPAGLRLGLLSFWLALLHVLMSMSLLEPTTYPKLFEGATLNFSGEASFLFGCVTTMLFAIPAAASIPQVFAALAARQRQTLGWIGYAGLGAAGLHVLAMGWSGWIQPGTWPAGMPPITLLSCIAVFVPIAAKLRRTRRRKESEVHRATAA